MVTMVGPVGRSLAMTSSAFWPNRCQLQMNPGGCRVRYVPGAISFPTRCGYPLPKVANVTGVGLMVGTGVGTSVGTEVATTVGLSGGVVAALGVGRGVAVAVGCCTACVAGAEDASGLTDGVTTPEAERG